MSDNKEETVWEAFDRILAEHPYFKLPPNFPHPLPWRKPSERPEDKRDVLCILTHSNDFFSGTCYWGDQEWKYTIEGEHSEYKMRQDDVVAWCYADEIPLPEGVKK